MVVQTDHGLTCEAGHILEFESGPDAPTVLGLPDPWERVRYLEAKQVMLASSNARLKSALRGMVTHGFRWSDKGTAPWYQTAMRALQGADAIDASE